MTAPHLTTFAVSFALGLAGTFLYFRNLEACDRAWRRLKAANRAVNNPDHDSDPETPR